MAIVLQEGGNADSTARTRSQVQVQYFIIPYTSIFIRLHYFYQEFFVHCIIMNNGGVGRGQEWNRWGVVDS